MDKLSSIGKSNIILFNYILFIIKYYIFLIEYLLDIVNGYDNI